MNDAYQQFLDRKRISDPETGITEHVSLRSIMKPHQVDITCWALRRGRAAVFAGTGLGKTLMELAWAEKVAEFTGKPVLIFAPLAVAEQALVHAVVPGCPVETHRAERDAGRGEPG